MLNCISTLEKKHDMPLTRHCYTFFHKMTSIILHVCAQHDLARCTLASRWVRKNCSSTTPPFQWIHVTCNWTGVPNDFPIIFLSLIKLTEAHGCFTGLNIEPSDVILLRSVFSVLLFFFRLQLKTDEKKKSLSTHEYLLQGWHGLWK